MTRLGDDVVGCLVCSADVELGDRLDNLVDLDRRRWTCLAPSCGATGTISLSIRLDRRLPAPPEHHPIVPRRTVLHAHAP